MKSITDLWEWVLKDLGEDLSAISIATWFDEVTPIGMGADTLRLYCPNAFKRATIERFYTGQIQKSLRSRFSYDIQICFVSDDEYAAAVGKRTSRHRSVRETGKFTFDTFVVGDSNRMAYHAAQAVAAGFDEYCNPLVIYGNPGLGKTHLLNAIASAVNASEPNAEVVCVKGDEFTNELVGAIREGKSAQFRAKYRSAEVFLVDDVQFIAGKKQTQEEFYNTFDALYQNGGSIVVTMDRPPRELSQLEERITSRFEGGLLVEIGEPDRDTRLEIIRQKARERGLSLDADAVGYIADQVVGSVRQLEGALNKLKVFAGQKPGEHVYEVIDRSPLEKVSRISPETVIEKVAAHYHVDKKLIVGKSRTKQAVAARQIVMYILCSRLGFSTVRVGEIMERDHSTVCYALRSMERKLSSDHTLAGEISSLMQGFFDRRTV